MYETIKELHIEIEQRIQQITSNRYGSMPSQFYDMMLNRTAIKYIQSKSNRKTNYKGEGLEDSMKRVEDFQSLKRETAWLPVLTKDGDTNRGFVLLPSNYLKFISSTSHYKYTKNISKELVSPGNNFKNVYYKVYDLNDVTSILGHNISELKSKFENGIEDNVELPKYLVEYLYDQLNNIVNSNTSPDIKYNVYWEHFNDRYYAHSIIITSDSNFNDNDNDNDSAINYTDKYFKVESDSYSENDLIASENIRAALNNPYSKKNRHLNPITELINDKLYVYQGQDFCVSEIKITYIKKPRLFSSDLDQMSDMTITPEFVDMVVSDILLILKDNTFNLVKQQTNIE